MPLPGYLSEEEQAQRLDRTVRTLRDWRKQGIGPNWVKDGKIIRYPEGADLDWLKTLEQRPVREPRIDHRRTPRRGRHG